MRALLLDLDDTLIDDRHAVRTAYAALIAAHRHRFPEATETALHASWREIARRHWARFERGEISFQEHRRERVREFLGRPFTDAEADEAFRPYLDAYQASWRPFDDVAPFLVRTAGLPKAIITNGEREQQLLKLRATGLADHFAVVVTPMDGGSWKPDPGIFQAALDALGAQAAQCAMIGDDQIRDIEPARHLGMQAFRVDAQDPERTLLKALDDLRL